MKFLSIFLSLILVLLIGCAAGAVFAPRYIPGFANSVWAKIDGDPAEQKASADSATIAPEAVASATITVNGEGRAQTKPDRAIISIGVSETATDVAQAQNACNLKIQAVTAALKAAGIGEGDLFTDSLNVYANYNYDYDNNTETTSGFTSSTQLTVKVNDIERAGEMIDVAIKAGANRLNGLSFTASDDIEARNAALADAVKDAREKVEVLAAALGKSVGELKEISESSGYSYSNVMNNYAMAADSTAASTELEIGMLTITANATFTYTLTD